MSGYVPNGSSESQFGMPPGPRPSHEEQVLRTERLQIERKVFVFSLRENARGRFVRITEDVGGRRDAIIIPGPGLGEFCQALTALVRSAAEPAPESIAVPAPS